MMIRMFNPPTRTEDDVDRENLLKDQVSHFKGQSYENKDQVSHLKGQSYDDKNVQASHQN